MALRQFGNTGLQVSTIGFGAMHFDGADSEAEVGNLLNGVLDAGVNLIDTARGYGRSEARIGKHLAHRRGEFVLSTKFGYGVDGVADWTAECITQGVERALGLMRTDHIDIGHLHSCPLHVLQRGEVTQALADCVQAGKLRVAAYSGENAELAHALADGRFGSVQCSLSLVDLANTEALKAVNGHGVLVKRALCGMAWQRESRPNDHCEGAYFDRWQALQLDKRLPDIGMDWAELSLRFAAFQPAVCSVLLGTKRLSNLKSAIDAVDKGALPTALQEKIHAAWRESSGGGANWPGIV